MQRTVAGRKWIAVLVAIAHGAALLFAASAPAFAAQCPVHAALMQSAAAVDHSGHGAGHIGHAAPDESGAPQTDGEGAVPHPMLSGSACCASLLIGVPAIDAAASGGNDPILHQAVIEPALRPVGISGADPPPRILL
jgi:hypothetical protein